MLIRSLFSRSTLKQLLRITLFFFVLLMLSLAYVGYITFNDPMPDKWAREQENTRHQIVADVTELYPLGVVDIVVPQTRKEIVDIVKKYNRVSIGGGRNSMGGQTASESAVHIDMRDYKKVLHFSPEKKEITVQTGARWRDIQDHIDPYDLSIKTMQTYSNFTLGGSLSVNVHGRYVGLGPLILSVKSFRIVMANGEVLEASPDKNKDIFYSAIGGMGGIGVITDATLKLADNLNLERSHLNLSTKDYGQYFTKQVRSNPEIIFHNADLYPPHFDRISAVNWTITSKTSTEEQRLIPRHQDYWLERFAWILISEWPGGRWIREHIIDPLIYSGEAPVHSRNYEASYDVAELEPNTREDSSYVLQEYFIPVERLEDWIPKMKAVFNDNDVNVINVSIRHAKDDPGALLAWAKGETFAFVVYYKQGTDTAAREKAATWTRYMIDEVLSVGGSYYLPYQIHATDTQFHRAYPGAVQYFEIKSRVDPDNKFTNALWDRYYSKEKLTRYKKRQNKLAPARRLPDYHRALDNAYLSLPEWYIVFSADEYAAVLRDGMPSAFPYFEAKNDYWRQYDIVSQKTRASTQDNSDYNTVLSVIGWSFATENVLKGLYEKSIGWLSEAIAGNKQVAEDHYAAQIAQDYATFIYDYPWYDFPYFKAFKGIWWLDHDVDHSGFQFVRRIERKLFLGLEYGLKSIYSGIIAYATHEQFGIQDDIVYALVQRSPDAATELIKAPHYQPFTRLLLKQLAQEHENPDFEIVDISGNNLITLTYQDVVGAQAVEGIQEVLRDREITSITEGIPHYKDRITLEVPLQKIPMVYKNLKDRGITIDHFYDY